MRTKLPCSFIVATVVLLFSTLPSEARKSGADKSDYRFASPPARTSLPSELRTSSFAGAVSAVADTFHLASYSFDSGGGPDKMGWTEVDLTAQLDDFFHVADASELDGGESGKLVPIEGAQSMWCGVAPSTEPPYCGYATLPGYGNNWNQGLRTDTLSCDSVRICYRICWDTEPGYDYVYLQNLEDDSWVELPVNGGTGFYEGTGLLDECLALSIPSGSTQLRFQFTSDTAWSDEDGLWSTDGAVLLDSITVECYEGGILQSTDFEDFEGATPGDNSAGIWTGEGLAGFGLYAALYPGITVVQEDPCRIDISTVWGFFDDPTSTNYACGGFPAQGAMPFGPDANELYLMNEIWSPVIPLTGAGDEVRLSFLVYRDLPLDNLQFYVWWVRSWSGNCPTQWSNNNFVFFGSQKDWFTHQEDVGPYIDLDADYVQIGIGAWDMCSRFCGIYGTGACHSHAPLIDEVRLDRIDLAGPRFAVRHIDLFQDNFAADGTTTGSARADMATDIAPWASPTLLPGDSIAASAKGGSTPLATDAHTGQGPAVYTYVAVWPQGQADKQGANLEASEFRQTTDGQPYGLRYPFVDTIIHDGVTWYCFRMDTVINQWGTIWPDKFCFDLNDAVFTPGDTICYVLSAENSLGQVSYWSRRLGGQGADFLTTDLAEALGSPCEFTILPAGGWRRGGEILYVDHADDRAGPPQMYFDDAFEDLGYSGLVDRYDVLGPSSFVENTLDTRVTNVLTQISGCYRTIIWNTGNLRAVLGDITAGNVKADDYGLLFTFLDASPRSTGLYLSGDDVAESWWQAAGAGAINLRSTYMHFNLLSEDHVEIGEPVSPLLAGSGLIFWHAGKPDSLVAYGGCPAINDFDVLEPIGLSSAELTYPYSGEGAVLSQQTQSASGWDARVILSGFSYDYIRDDRLGYPMDRVDHLGDILIYLQHFIIPDAIDPLPVLANHLGSAFPNPFNPTTTIRYGVAERGHVALRIYNVAGQLVRTLVDEVKVPQEGGFTATWDGRNDAGQSVSSGIYFYKITATHFARTRKMALLK